MARSCHSVRSAEQAAGEWGSAQWSALRLGLPLAKPVVPATVLERLLLASLEQLLSFRVRCRRRLDPLSHFLRSQQAMLR